MIEEEVKQETSVKGRARTQAVSHWLPNAASQVRTRVWSCGISGGQALGQVFSKYFGFPCQSSFHQLLHNHHHLSFGAGKIWPVVAAVPSGLSLTPLRKNNQREAVGKRRGKWRRHVPPKRRLTFNQRHGVIS
jgi:hypothetical protein